MAVSFNVPASPKRNIIQIDDFLGADFTNSPASAELDKSPSCENMIRDVPGKVRKCMGYEMVWNYGVVTSDQDLFGTYTCDAKMYVNNRSVAEIKIKEGRLKIHQIVSLSGTDTRTASVSLKDIGDKSLLNQATLALLYQSHATNRCNARIHFYPDMPSISGTPQASFYVEALDDESYSLRIECLFTSATEDLSLRVRYNGAQPYGSYSKTNGFHKLRGDSKGLIHMGNEMLYASLDNGASSPLLLYENANDTRSRGWEFNEHIYILDGKKFLRFGKDLAQKSDVKYSEDKTNNEVVINEWVTLTVKRYNTPMYSLEIYQVHTTSPNGSFTVSPDKTKITYTDKLTSVNQDVSYGCAWEYKKKSTSSIQTDATSVHHLIGLTDQGTPTVIPVEDDAYIPLVTISKDPEGGGEPYEDLNLLTPAFKEQFLGKASVKDYSLSFDDLDPTQPIAEVLDNSGEWIELEYGTDYTCEYSTGVITFTTAPGVSPVTGEDNVRITAYRTVNEYADRINKCTIGALFGVNGALDRLFLSGNPDYINYDWYSAQYDPSYFADTSYSVLGSSASAIVGYSIISNYLAAHKDSNERDQNIILREGDLVESEPSFRIINTLQGAGAVAPFSFAYLATEPLFLTEQGIYAVTAQDITGEKYAQNRSFYLDGKLLNEQGLEDAYAIVHKDMYWLCLNDVAYILDGLQPIQTDKQKPYATRQYVGFYRTNLPARVMWEDEGRLYFGTNDGRIYRFYDDKYDLPSYNDDGETIECVWDTADIIGKPFFKNKTLRFVAVKLDSAHSASVNIYAMNRGLWEFIRKDSVHAKYLQFTKTVFSKFSFSCDRTQHTIPSKVRVKKVDKFRLRLTNDELNESFAIYNIGFEYIQGNNYKG